VERDHKIICNECGKIYYPESFDEIDSRTRCVCRGSFYGIADFRGLDVWGMLGEFRIFEGKEIKVEAILVDTKTLGTMNIKKEESDNGLFWNKRLILEGCINAWKERDEK